MNQKKHLKFTRIILSIVSILFGVVTVFAGFNVLSGSDPGYIIFKPLLIFNTIMGFVYLATGVLAWRNVEFGKKAASVVFTLNIIMLGIISVLYSSGDLVAINSMQAMSFRTVIWFVIFIVLFWLSKKNNQNEI